MLDTKDIWCPDVMCSCECKCLRACSTAETIRPHVRLTHISAFFNTNLDMYMPLKMCQLIIQIKLCHQRILLNIVHCNRIEPMQTAIRRKRNKWDRCKLAHSNLLSSLPVAVIVSPIYQGTVNRLSNTKSCCVINR